MKLRNKETGEIIDLEQWRLEYYKDSGCITLTNEKNQNEQYCYRTFADMKDDWADYIPPEPLIKDERIRKAVRAWAEACGADDTDIVRHYGTERWLGLRYENPNTGWVSKFEVDGFGSDNQLDHEKVYTIGELCGEEEE